MDVFVVVIYGKKRLWVEVFERRDTAEEFVADLKGAKTRIFERTIKVDSLITK